MNKELVQLKRSIIYDDPQTLEGPTGEAILLEKLGDGLPFILEEDDAYLLEEWLGVDPTTLQKVTVYIRKYIDQSRVTSGYKREPIKSYENYLVDKFLEVDGVEIF